GWLWLNEVCDGKKGNTLPIHIELTPCCHTMEVASVFELRQSEELFPIQSNWILNVTVNLKFPFVERDFWPNAEIQHGKVMDLPLAGWQTIGGPYRRAFLACHFARPTLFCRNVCFLHCTSRLPESLPECQRERREKRKRRELRSGHVQAGI